MRYLTLLFLAGLMLLVVGCGPSQDEVDLAIEKAVSSIPSGPTQQDIDDSIQNAIDLIPSSVSQVEVIDGIDGIQKTFSTKLTNDPGMDFQASWSPDGTKIVFVSNRDGNNEIYIMNADGSNQINISNHSSHDTEPSWSPDGTKIIFHSNRSGNDEIYIVMNVKNEEQAAAAAAEQAASAASVVLKAERDAAIRIVLYEAPNIMEHPQLMQKWQQLEF